MNSLAAGIPIIIGVTGHRDLRESDEPQIRKLVYAELNKLKSKYSHSTFIMLNSLAQGGDLLCAKIALELGISLQCPLPLPLEEYRQDFSGEVRIQFEELLNKADRYFVSEDTETSNGHSDRDYHYRQAGIYIAEHSQVLLALWDGSKAKKDGCGTSEIVDIMLRGRPDSTSIFKASNDGAVLQIVTPRSNSKEEIEIKANLIENETGSVAECLNATDQFNKDLKELIIDNKIETIMPLDQENDPRLNVINYFHQVSNQLSLFFQKKYLTAMRRFALFAVMLVLSFLLYDELECNFFLPVYGGIILVYALILTIVNKRHYHQKYLHYRLFAEALRIQFYLNALNLSENIGDYFTWTQKKDTVWIKEAISALLIGEKKTNYLSLDTIKKSWVNGQYEYHSKALNRDLKKGKVNQTIALTMLIFSLALFITVFILEFFFPKVMETIMFTNPLPSFLLPHSGQQFSVRSFLKIILGTVSAITLFVSNYYGKLSFERKTIDHEKMMRLYQQADNEFEQSDYNSRLFLNLAREEMIENGEWFSYCRENKPTFNL